MIGSAQYNRMLFDQSPIGLALTRMNGELVDVNPAFARIVGRNVEETLGLTYWQLTPESYAEQEQVQLENLKAAGRYGPYEKHYIHQDGRLVPVRLNGLLLEQQGETYIWSSVEDITERVAVEQALQKSEQHLTTLMHMLPGMFYRCVYNKGFSLAFASEGSKEITGYTAAEMVKQHFPCFELAHPTDSGWVLEQVDAAVRERTTYKLEYRIIARNGQEKWVWDQGRALYKGKGGFTELEGYVTDITERKRAEQAIQHMAFHDSLTGLVNRHEFNRRLRIALAGASSSGREHVLLYLDLDHFKQVNDSCGHAAGDELLIQISATINQHLRERDTLARLGGDEFAVLLENCPLDHAYAIALGLIEAVADYRFTWEQKSFRLGVSVGLAAIRSTRQTSEDLLRQADIACYKAKHKGRNRACIYNPEDERCFRPHGEVHWIADIHDALEQGQFTLFAQPILPLAQQPGNKMFYEILVRMRGTDDALLLPGAFMPAAERFHLMPSIDRWVIRTTLAQLRQLADSGTPTPGEPDVSINLSLMSLQDQDLVEYISDCLQEYRIEPRRLCFEIAETAFITCQSATCAFLEAMHQLGCRAAIDGYGSGFGAFRDLDKLAVDFVKIDASFTRKLLQDRTSSAIVRSIAEIGALSGKQTIAENIEESAVRDTLGKLGVDFVQGYVTGKPSLFEGRQAIRA